MLLVVSCLVAAVVLCAAAGTARTARGRAMVLPTRSELAPSSRRARLGR